MTSNQMQSTVTLGSGWPAIPRIRLISPNTLLLALHLLIDRRKPKELCNENGCGFIISNFLSFNIVSSDGIAEWCKDDKWASNRPKTEPNAIVLGWSHLWSGILCRLSWLSKRKYFIPTYWAHQTSLARPYLHGWLSCVEYIVYLVGLGEAPVWFVFLPYFGSGETKLWSSRVEHSLRLQWVRPEDQRQTTPNVLEWVQGDPFWCHHLHDRCVCVCWNDVHLIYISVHRDTDISFADTNSISYNLFY